ncbi:hypothetical protein LINPERHAP2_LOCUS13355, partial [Linum perenne]
NLNSVPLSRSYDRKLLCDGSFQDDVQKAGIGVIMFNSEGHAIDGVAGSFFCRAPIVAEAYALLSAVRLACRENLSAIILSDCQQLTSALRGHHSSWPWECSAIIADIVLLLSSNPCIEVSHCRRTEVKLADNVANLARRGILLPGWLSAMVL